MTKRRNRTASEKLIAKYKSLNYAWDLLYHQTWERMRDLETEEAKEAAREIELGLDKIKDSIETHYGPAIGTAVMRDVRMGCFHELAL